MSEKVIIGHLAPGNPLFEIFPDGTVPLLHLFPVLFESFTEPCYLVDGSGLSDLQVTQVCQWIINGFPELVETYEEFKAYIRKDFPILCSHFRGVEMDEPGLRLFCMDDRFDADDNRDLDGYDCEEDG
jgi:hypothetical protein